MSDLQKHVDYVESLLRKDPIFAGCTFHARRKPNSRWRYFEITGPDGETVESWASMSPCWRARGWHRYNVSYARVLLTEPDEIEVQI